MPSHSRVMRAIAVVIAVSWVIALPVRAAKFNRVLDIGDQAPAWKELPGVDGRRHSLMDLKNSKAVVVVFTCNHCPVAKGYEKRLVELARAMSKRRVSFVAISVSLYDTDRLPAMKKASAGKKLPYQYLHDESQSIGRKYGALCTPHVFLLNAARKVVYMGRIDDSIYEERASEHFLRDALQATLAGKQVDVAETKPIGCPIAFEPVITPQRASSPPAEPAESPKTQ